MRFTLKNILCLIKYCVKLINDERARSDAEACTYLVLIVDTIDLDVFYAPRVYIRSSYQHGHIGR